MRILSFRRGEHSAAIVCTTKGLELWEYREADCSGGPERRRPIAPDAADEMVTKLRAAAKAGTITMLQDGWRSAADALAAYASTQAEEDAFIGRHPNLKNL